mmetsp:Transcript_91646/g.264305  ORF Transcript_91646/g.264305 Transcript_91646/m.264305 type:complete len:310 (+) Transcript_91646:672-1601(+)
MAQDHPEGGQHPQPVERRHVQARIGLPQLGEARQVARQGPRGQERRANPAGGRLPRLPVHLVGRAKHQERGDGEEKAEGHGAARRPDDRRRGGAIVAACDPDVLQAELLRGAQRVLFDLLGGTAARPAQAHQGAGVQGPLVQRALQEAVLHFVAVEAMLVVAEVGEGWQALGHERRRQGQRPRQTGLRIWHEVNDELRAAAVLFHELLLRGARLRGAVDQLLREAQTSGMALRHRYVEASKRLLCQRAVQQLRRRACGLHSDARGASIERTEPRLAHAPVGGRRDGRRGGEEASGSACHDRWAGERITR